MPRPVATIDYVALGDDPILIDPSERGFASGRFFDRYAHDCTIRKSSLATEDCVWLGTSDNPMHLTKRRAGELGAMLVHFSFTGELVEASGVERYTLGVVMGVPRTHTVRRGESWHGIAKRLADSADPGELLGLVQRLKEVNGPLGVTIEGSCPYAGVELRIPSEWAERPLVDQSSPAGAQRISLLAVEEMERLRSRLALEEVAAREYLAIDRMGGWQFLRWAWSYYWKGERPTDCVERRANEDWGPRP